MADPHPSFARLKSAAAAADSAISLPIDLARALGEKPQTITNWAARGVSKEGALNAQLELGVSATWVLYGRQPALVSQSQSARLDPVKMAEALVAVVKAQEELRFEFRASAIAEALTRAYDLRILTPGKMDKAQLQAFDKMITEAVKQAWEANDGTGTGATAKGAGDGNAQTAPKRRQA